MRSGGERVRITAARREQVRAALAEAGLGLFAARGVAATSIEQIAAAAGVAKGTFYNYFATKEDLALAALVPVLQRAGEALAAAPAATLASRLGLVFAEFERFTGDNPQLIWIWCLEGLRRGEAEPGWALLRGLLAGLCAQAQAGGALRADRDPQELALGLQGVVLAGVGRWYHAGAGSDLRAELGRATGLFLEGAQVGGGRP